MVSPLLISRGLRKEENNEKKRKRVKRNEIQCMILLRSLIFGSTKSEICSEKDFKFLYIMKLFLTNYCLMFLLAVVQFEQQCLVNQVDNHTFLIFF